MTEQERRAATRRRYSERCGYCGVHESEAGADLEIDHFQPRSAGGSDDPDNLVYCCPTCNRFKGDFHPENNPSTPALRLLHPLHDDLAQHMREDADCLLAALSPMGTFHIDRLKLNRPPLVALRRARQDVAQIRRTLAAAQAEEIQLRIRIAALEQEVQDMIIQLARLTES
jgi:hypothetical protein